MLKNGGIIISKYFILIMGLIATLGVVPSQAGQATPDALAKTMVSSINAKNKTAVQSLIHPQVVSYLRVTNPAMLHALRSVFPPFPGCENNGPATVNPKARSIRRPAVTPAHPYTDVSMLASITVL